MTEIRLEYKLKEDVRLFRILFLMAAFFMVAFHYVFIVISVDNIDPIGPRLLVAFIAFILLGLTYLDGWFRKNIIISGYLLGHIITLIYFYYMAINQMNIAYSVGVFTVLIAVSSIIRHRSVLITYLLFTVLGSIFVNFYVNEPEANPILFSSMLICVTTILFVTLSSRIRLFSKMQLLSAAIEEKNSKILKQSNSLEEMFTELEKHNIDLKDSIKYAHKIQTAILPPTNVIQRHLKDSFILYKPKDIVSGDFYWIENFEDRVYFATIDCTGHGVPGAFMSIVGYIGLRNILKEDYNIEPSKILDQLNVEVNAILRHKDRNSEVKDGMDISLCYLDIKNKRLSFSGAINPIYIVRKGELIEYKGNPFSIGTFAGLESRPFSNHIIELESGDMIYSITDGFADQFGGPNNKKFKYQPLRELLSNISNLPVYDQEVKLLKAFNSWKGSRDQIDDVCIFGIKIP